MSHFVHLVVGENYDEQMEIFDTRESAECDQEDLINFPGFVFKKEGTVESFLKDENISSERNGMWSEQTTLALDAKFDRFISNAVVYPLKQMMSISEAIVSQTGQGAGLEPIIFDSGYVVIGGDYGYFYNPNGKYDYYCKLSGSNYFEKMPLPLYLKNGTQADSALAREIDWSLTKEKNTNGLCWSILMDGKWYEEGYMGLFGEYTPNDLTDDWVNMQWKILEKIPAKALVSLFDCHV